MAQIHYICPNCKKSLRYIPQYKNWYCDYCKVYIYPQQPYPQQQYQPRPAYVPPKIKTIIFWFVVISLILSLIGLFLVCSGPFNSVESIYFTFDSDAELNDVLLDRLYYNLDTNSRLNVTNETYFLILSIPDLDYSIRFDYLFESTIDNLTNLRIDQHSKVPKITNFEGRYSYNPYNLSIEFHINSTDQDILNVTIFPPENIIDGELYLVGVDVMTLTIRLDEGEVIHEDTQHGRGYERMILTYNQIIIGVVDYDHLCPFY
ncbi:MAG: hypothetical protein JSV56_11595 [Methanomassiliicoccales archaeon]|nr:MAG: hypothetical protein JSV56_11595 [Methanomassiliicoccales archaeon]